jgi:hypothetical protein
MRLLPSQKCEFEMAANPYITDGIFITGAGVESIAKLTGGFGGRPGPGEKFRLRLKNDLSLPG